MTSQSEIFMRHWPVQDAKAHFSELVETCLTNGPQLVSRRGEPKVVMVSFVEWELLQKRARPTLKEVLLAPEPRFDLALPDRTQWKMREIPDFE
jgi:prevent-host-death family protein